MYIYVLTDDILIPRVPPNYIRDGISYIKGFDDEYIKQIQLVPNPKMDLSIIFLSLFYLAVYSNVKTCKILAFPEIWSNSYPWSLLDTGLYTNHPETRNVCTSYVYRTLFYEPQISKCERGRGEGEGHRTRLDWVIFRRSAFRLNKKII